RDVGLHGVLVTADLRDTTRRAATKPPLSLGQILAGRFYTGWPLHVESVRVSDATFGGMAVAPDSGARSERLSVRARAIRLGRGFEFQLDSLAATLYPRGGTRDSVVLVLAGGLSNGGVELRRLRFLGAASDVEGHGSLSYGGRDSLEAAGLTLHA